jgi:Phosphotransferase enzyme family
LPTQAASLVAELALTGAGAGGLSVSQAQALEARLPSYGQWCRDLDDSGLPTTIQHDDLHSDNICWPGSARDRLAGPGTGSRVIDWGDASIGHPFGTMLTALRSIAHHGRCDVDDARVLRVRDAYLEAFTTYAPSDRLVSDLNRAVRVGAVTRALSWRHALTASPTRVQRDLDFPVRNWLLDLLRP